MPNFNRRNYKNYFSYGEKQILWYKYIVSSIISSIKRGRVIGVLPKANDFKRKLLLKVNINFLNDGSVTEREQ